MECKLQTMPVVERCVFRLSIKLLTLVVQVRSLSYHAGTGNIALGRVNGQVDMWKSAPLVGTAPQATLSVRAPQAALVCVRTRLAEARAKADVIEASLGKADSGLRQLLFREQELKNSIADLEAKCAHMI